MTVILDGKLFANEILEDLKLKIHKLIKKPKLAVIIAGNNPASEIYVRNKKQKAENIGIDSCVIKLPEDVTEKELLKQINLLNNDKDVNGILVQLPLPKHINKQKIIEEIAPIKDCDGFTSYNFGKLVLNYTPYSIPCTPKGIIRLMGKYNIEIQGKHALVVGRSNIVGKPISILLQQKNATVTMANSYTNNLKEISKTADIIICAIGKPNFIKGDFIKEGAVIIDVGINRTETGLAGDVNYKECYDKASYITPVPGGIGPVTIAMLMENTYELYKLQSKINSVN